MMFRINLQRMLQSTQLHLGEREGKIRHKSTGFQSIATRTNAFEGMRHSRALNNFIFSKNRRKIQMLEEQQPSFALWRRQFVKQSSLKGCFRPVIDSIDRQESVKFAKRNTLYTTDEKSPIENDRRSRDPIAVGRSKTKNSTKDPEIVDRKSRICNLYANTQKKRDLFNKNKATIKQSPKLTKQYKELSQTTTKAFKQRFLQTSLVSLITKFKFQNLRQNGFDPEQEESRNFRKAGNVEPLDNFSKAQRVQNYGCLFPPSSEFQGQKKSKQREKMHKTMMRIGWTGQTGSQKVTRRACALSPWQIDNQQQSSAVDIF